MRSLSIAYHTAIANCHDLDELRKLWHQIILHTCNHELINEAEWHSLKEALYERKEYLEWRKAKYGDLDAAEKK